MDEPIPVIGRETVGAVAAARGDVESLGRFVHVELLQRFVRTRVGRQHRRAGMFAGAVARGCASHARAATRTVDGG